MAVLMIRVTLLNPTGALGWEAHAQESAGEATRIFHPHVVVHISSLMSLPDGRGTDLTLEQIQRMFALGHRHGYLR